MASLHFLKDEEKKSNKKLYNALLEMKELKYKASSSLKNHENEIEKILQKYKLTKVNRNILNKEQISSIINADPNINLDFLPDSCFIREPAGSQRSPDFLIKEGNKYFYLDIKCRRKAVPMWNGGFPKSGILYVFTSNSFGTIIMTAEDIISLEDLDKLKRAKERIRRYVKFLSSRFPKNANFHIYPRLALDDRNGEKYRIHHRDITIKTLEKVLKFYE